MKVRFGVVPNVDLDWSGLVRLSRMRRIHVHGRHPKSALIAMVPRCRRRMTALLLPDRPRRLAPRCLDTSNRA
jgi:hypothetical protein